MTIEINKEKYISKASILEEILGELNISLKGIAVAINDEVISRMAWKETQIQENDKITIIRATQGG